ncbi:GIY-YIG nuclease family protein [Vibrio sp. Y2-5]|uniref:GIY-YIG nuclease family protein n=1 Tax=Vibrio sp. Y2-5 TaxID=2743977 RepID=UPI0016616864|nr:GIY-YIG nuclease family protein [Vibrio sp. Y2-5]MBD0787162.1 GIY-YIG nuclease family protein [Vibrio sp. Y2-5]
MSTLNNSEKSWWVYFVRTPQNSLYCGITTDVERRFGQHCSGTGAKALRGKSPLELVWSHYVGDKKSDALRLEYRIKRLSKIQKEKLVQQPSLLSVYIPN